MSEEKIEARLQEEILRAEKVGEGSREIPVLIELEAASYVGPGGIRTLEESVRAAQQGLRSKLDELGAGKTVRAMTLANAVEARLMPAGIREIARLPEVKRIVWNRADRVTA